MTARSIGDGTKVWHFAHVSSGARIGERCSLGQNVFVASGVVIGDNVRIQNNVSVYDAVTLEDDVFCGPSMVFTNVQNPRAAVPRKHDYKPTLVRRGATLGANCTVVCGATIGRWAFVGAGAVVTARRARLRARRRRAGAAHRLDEPPRRAAGPAGRDGRRRRARGDLPGHRGALPAARERVRAARGRAVVDTLPFIDLKAQYAALKPAIDARIQRVLDHGQYILGPEVRELEERAGRATRRRATASPWPAAPRRC